jgi:hypothetical protein
MQKNKNWRISWKISLAILVIMAGVTILSLVRPELYQDNHFIQSVWRGNDMVTLLAALPVFGLGLYFSRKGSTAGELIRLGMLDYVLYNYAFYLTAAAFSVFFLPYVILIVLAALGLLAGLLGLDAEQVKSQFGQKLPARWIAGYQFFVAAGLTAVYLIQYFTFVFRGELPSIVAKSGHVTNIVPALDLTLLVPWMALGGIWLWGRKPWGYVLSGIMVVKGLVYTLVLAGAGCSAVQAGYPEAAAEIPLWGSLCLGFAAALGIMLYHLRVGKESNHEDVVDPKELM